MVKSKLIFLGTGSSNGIPVVGCDCSICHSASPYNQRCRSSVILTINNTNFLIDVTPDFRLQALKYNIKQLDGVLITHTHYDHIGGLDDLRVFTHHRPLPCLISQEALTNLKARYSYIFLEREEEENFKAQFTFQVLPPSHGQVRFLEQDWTYVSYSHGNMGVTGFKMGDLAYITDIKKYCDELFDYLKGTKILILSMPIQDKSSHIHFNLRDALRFVNQLQPQKTILTHISHDLDHCNVKLPHNLELSYDGMIIDFNT